MSRLARFTMTRARRPPAWSFPPLPLDPLTEALRAASKRGDELLGPALDMIDQRRRLGQRAKLATLVGLLVIVYLVLLLHPNWPLSHWLL